MNFLNYFLNSTENSHNNLNANNTLKASNNYACKIVATASQTIPIKQITTIVGMTSNQATGFNNSLNNMADDVNSRINIKKSGVYRISATIGTLDPRGYYGNDSHLPQLCITLNSSNIVLSTGFCVFANYPQLYSFLTGETSGFYKLNEGDYISLRCYQVSNSPSIQMGGWSEMNSNLYGNMCYASLSAELI